MSLRDAASAIIKYSSHNTVLGILRHALRFEFRVVLDPWIIDVSLGNGNGNGSGNLSCGGRREGGDGS